MTRASIVYPQAFIQPQSEEGKYSKYAGKSHISSTKAKQPRHEVRHLIWKCNATADW